MQSTTMSNKISIYDFSAIIEIIVAIIAVMVAITELRLFILL